MVSPTAIADIKAAISSGVVLTPEEIIRLNALGLRYDYSKHGAEMRIMPRIAWLGDVAFREPTIGHEIWMYEAADIFDLEDGETRIKVRAFCLATDPLMLPPFAQGKDQIEHAVKDFCKAKLSAYTLGQVAAALVFAEYGDVQTARELAEPKPPTRKQKSKPEPDGERCYEVGLLRNGILLKLGSPEQLRGMTVSGLETLITEAMRFDKRFGMDYAKSLTATAFADYKRTLDAVLAAHRPVSKIDTQGMHNANDYATPCKDEGYDIPRAGEASD